MHIKVMSCSTGDKVGLNVRTARMGGRNEHS